MKRVVVTGMAGISPLGSDWSSVCDNLRRRKGTTIVMPQWADYDKLHTKLACPVRDFQTPTHYTRKQRRSMGKVALMAVSTCEMALIDAGLLHDPILSTGSVGVAYGSSSGSSDDMIEISRFCLHDPDAQVEPTTYLKMMSHTCAANIGLFFGLRGAILPVCSACTSGSHSIGYALDMIRSGRQKVMLTGGAEELHLSQIVVFDRMLAASTSNHAPEHVPRPFDRERDGLVVGEGAATLILEELSHAQARNARIYAELVGFGTNSDGTHITRPNAESMRDAMALSLKDAQLTPDAIGYINAHATATEWGDIAESQATFELFGSKTPVSGLKGYIGQTLGACGAIEAWLSIQMMNDEWFAPNLHLEHLDPRCSELDYIVDDGRKLSTEYVITNNFSFLGINTSLIFKRWHT
jgi:3-oxoacyl-[acyl-carrier-protein] synthase II